VCCACGAADYIANVYLNSYIHFVLCILWTHSYIYKCMFIHKESDHLVSLSEPHRVVVIIADRLVSTSPAKLYYTCINNVYTYIYASERVVHEISAKPAE